MRGGRVSPHARTAASVRRARVARSIGGALEAVEQADHRVEVVDLELTRGVGAAEAELAGRAQQVRDAAGERTVKTGPPATVGGSCEPSQKRSANGRSGSARASSRRSGSGWASTGCSPVRGRSASSRM